MPLCSSYENTGTYINVSGIWQSFLSTVKCEKMLSKDGILFVLLQML